MKVQKEHAEAGSSCTFSFEIFSDDVVNNSTNHGL